MVTFWPFILHTQHGSLSQTWVGHDVILVVVAEGGAGGPLAAPARHVRGADHAVRVPLDVPLREGPGPHTPFSPTDHVSVVFTQFVSHCLLNI